MMAFTIKTHTFEGPLDLLLDLIEKRKFFINDVSLAKVTDDFIEHIKRLGVMPMGESAHFILIASTLLLIKSKSLLPGLNITEEEKGDIRDLEIRLKVYKKIKEASIHVNELFGTNIIFPQSQARAIEPVFAPDPQFTTDKALSMLKDLLNRLPKKENVPQILVKKVISLEEMIGTLAERVTKHLKMSFREFIREHKKDRVNVIISFLAMLELVKQGALEVTQNRNFSDILMKTKQVGLPKY